VSTHQYAVYYVRFIIINYVNEHQLPHIVNASHITPTIYVNHTCQSGFYIIEIDWLETLSVF